MRWEVWDRSWRKHTDDDLAARVEKYGGKVEEVDSTDPTVVKPLLLPPVMRSLNVVTSPSFTASDLAFQFWCRHTTDFAAFLLPSLWLGEGGDDKYVWLRRKTWNDYKRQGRTVQVHTRVPFTWNRFKCTYMWFVVCKHRTIRNSLFDAKYHV